MLQNKALTVKLLLFLYIIRNTQSNDKPLAVSRSPEIIVCFEDATESNTIVEDPSAPNKTETHGSF